jgi:quinone-modifying oxidoreductase subunit QmoC
LKIGSGGESLKKCFQCATCSVTCALAPENAPFPRKEMIWTQWGMKNKLVANPDIWLCHQCNDCSTHCPRGARPGDVMAAIRRESIIQFATPGFLGKWVSQPKFLPLIIIIPTILLGLALLVRDPIEKALGMTKYTTDMILYSNTNIFPHWLLNSFFFFFTFLAVIAVITGVGKMWKAMKTADTKGGNKNPVKSMGSSIVTALKKVFTHDDFTTCSTERTRFLSHTFVFYGFLALLAVCVWIITARYNPLVSKDFVYIFSLFSPWKILANLGGLAIVCGCLLMIYERIKERDQGEIKSTFFDWAFLLTLLAVVVTGFATEVFHYGRVPDLRHIAYFIHLDCVFILLIYLPYSKFTHVIYRTTAMVYAEYTGRGNEVPVATEAEKQENEQQKVEETQESGGES